jgi:hypothetical protein
LLLVVVAMEVMVLHLLVLVAVLVEFITELVIHFPQQPILSVLEQVETDQQQQLQLHLVLAP